MYSVNREVEKQRRTAAETTPNPDKPRCLLSDSAGAPRHGATPGAFDSGRAPRSAAAGSLDTYVTLAQLGQPGREQRPPSSPTIPHGYGDAFGPNRLFARRSAQALTGRGGAGQRLGWSAVEKGAGKAEEPRREEGKTGRREKNFGILALGWTVKKRPCC